jgi:hypothetical protein
MDQNLSMKPLGQLCHFTLSLLAFSSFSGYAASPLLAREAARLVPAFGRNPRAVLESLPPKAGHATPRPFRFLSAHDITSREFVVKKATARGHMLVERDGQSFRLEQLQPGRAGFTEHDVVEEIVDVPPSELLRTLDAMEGAHLRSARLESDSLPWSDSYWPIYQGQSAARYADAAFNRVADREDWKALHDWAHDPSRAFAQIFAELGAGRESPYSLDQLSPAEKYDLLVGDARGSLTQRMWDEGRVYSEDKANKGKVELWMGLCHGWAAAALMEPRPRQSVKLLAADGHTSLKFYPADIKALATTMWANAEVPARYVGERCTDKDPKKDENGRVVSTQCFDTNPGTWHQTIVNQIGRAKRGFVMDATYDFEVWNHPVFGYEYSYFNPQTESIGDNLAAATVSVSEFTKDKFKRYRSPEAKSIVGIVMKVDYAFETEPTHDESDGPDNDAHEEVIYMYDLELDAGGRIVGGEWYMNAHPDFLWVNPPNARVRNSADSLTQGSWQPALATVPAAWRDLAPTASQSGLPLAKIVKGLLSEARNSSANRDGADREAPADRAPTTTPSPEASTPTRPAPTPPPSEASPHHDSAPSREPTPAPRAERGTRGEVEPPVVDEGRGDSDSDADASERSGEYHSPRSRSRRSRRTRREYRPEEPRRDHERDAGDEANEEVTE